MIDFGEIENGILGIAILGPGFLIMFGRSRFLTGRMVNLSSSIFEYLMVSSIYYAFAFPAFRQLNDPSYTEVLSFLFLGPLLSGFALGFMTQKNVFRWLAKKLNLNPVHSSPTAWDFVFSDRSGPSWVVASLASGRKYYGIFDQNSLASSELSRRDIFIENICDENFKPIEADGRKRGVWINESELLSIEIIKDELNDQRK